MWRRKETVWGSFKSDNEPSGSIKCGEFLDYLRTGQLLKKDSDWRVALTTPSI